MNKREFNILIMGTFLLVACFLLFSSLFSDIQASDTYEELSKMDLYADHYHPTPTPMTYRLTYLPVILSYSKPYQAE